MRKNLGRLALILFALIAASSNAHAQAPVIATGSIVGNVAGTSVTLFTAKYKANVTAITLSTTGILQNCTQLPQVYLMQNGLVFSVATLTNDEDLWSFTDNLPWPILSGDAITALLVTSGDVGCLNDDPIGVTVTYQIAPAVPVPVSFTVQDVGGSPSTSIRARFTLVNCGANIPATGQAILPQATKDFSANPQGAITGVLYPTDGVLCAGQATTYYQLSYLINGVPSTIVGKYLIRSGTGTFNPSLAPVCIAGLSQTQVQQFCSLLGTPAGPIMIGPVGASGPPGPAGPPGRGEPGGEDFTIAIDQPGTTDSGIIQHKIHTAANFVRISCYAPSISGTDTVTFNLDIRTEAAPGTAGNDVLSSPLTCGSTTQVVTNFLHGSFDADAPIALDILSVTGTPQVLNIHVSTAPQN